MDSTPLILIERHKKGKAYKVIKLLNDLNPSYSLPLLELFVLTLEPFF